MSPSRPKDRAKVILLPPLLVGYFLAMGFFLERAYPLPFLAGTFSIGLIFVLAGTGVALWAIRTMKSFGASPNIYKPTPDVVTSGPFRFSRNPIYLAFVLGIIGVGAMMNSLWFLLLLMPFMLLLHYGVIVHEEEYLANKFGEGYLRYKASVRRWI